MKRYRGAMAIFLLTMLSNMACSTRADVPPVSALAFTPDNKAVVVASQTGARILDWPTLKPAQSPRRKLETKLVHIHAIAFNPKGDRIALAGGSPSEHGTVELFTWPKGELLYRKKLHDDVIHSLAWTNDGARYVTASSDQACHVVHPKTGRICRSFTGHSGAVLAVRIMDDGKTVVSAGVDQVLHVWALVDAKPMSRRHNHTDTITSLAVQPFAATTMPIVATGSLDRTVRLWQPTIGRMMRFARLPSGVLCLAWTPDGKQLLAGCRDGGVYVVDAETVTHRRCAKLAGWVYQIATLPKGGKTGDNVGGETGRETGGVAVGASNGTLRAVPPNAIASPATLSP